MKYAPAEHHPRDKKRIEEGGDLPLTLLYWLFRHKNVMPWDAYERLREPGWMDLTWALALCECGDREK